ncbi:MAG: diguanylate cyclase [Bacillota bacterium]|nr:diguanylate cyclase [Bacillota bacterium]
MTGEKQYSLLGGKLRKKYLLAFFIIAITSVASFLTMTLLINNNETSAYLINTSGRQRMLSQRAALLSMELAQAPSLEQEQLIKAELHQTVSEMKASHLKLGKMAEETPALNDIYFKEPINLHHKIDIYLHNLELFLASNDTTWSNPTLALIVHDAKDNLITALELFVNELQAGSEQKVQQLKFTELFLLIIILSVLLVEGLFIFKPMILHIQEEHKQLEAANEELYRLSCVDGLTGIANRRYLDKYLDIEIQNAERTKIPVSVIMGDIDFFKSFNDTYGHIAGDECLKSVAKTLSTTVKRPRDIVARYGGEEFAIILPETDTEGALIIAEKLRLAVAGLEMEHSQSPLSSFVTISLGVATYSPLVDTADTAVLSRADKALYRAKERGRNQVCC